MLMIECNACHEKAYTLDGSHPDLALKCGCCQTEHDHGKHANETGQPCRPVTVHVLPGSATLSVM